MDHDSGKTNKNSSPRTVTALRCSRLKICSAKAETTEIKLRTVSKHEMSLIKVIGNEKISIKIILAHAETTEIMLRTVSKHKMT